MRVIAAEPLLRPINAPARAPYPHAITVDPELIVRASTTERHTEIPMVSPKIAGPQPQDAVRWDSEEKTEPPGSARRKQERKWLLFKQPLKHGI
jgi:hypothetical protein